MQERYCVFYGTEVGIFHNGTWVVELSKVKCNKFNLLVGCYGLWGKLSRVRRCPELYDRTL